ncbi:hypothetical protein V2J09_004694 [Rumex salicifolius]
MEIVESLRVSDEPAEYSAPPPPESIFTPTQIPRQRVFSGMPFPLALSPAVLDGGSVDKPTSCSSLADAVRAHKQWVEDRLRDAGAVLFRGFGVRTASEFNDVVEAFGYEEAPFMVGGAPRTHVVGQVFTSNDGPPHINLHFHNEMAYIDEHPSKAFFYCQVEPESQGETPIVLGHIVYRRMKANHPDFMDRLEKHGLLYTRVLPDGPDPSSILGRGWQSTFGTHDKHIAQLKASRLGWTLEWSNDGVRVTMGSVLGVKVVESSLEGERKTWFNSLVAAYTSWVDSRNELGSGVRLGDGTAIPTTVVEDSKKIMEEECVAFPWRQGDVLMLDNCAALHARRPYTGPRRVLAAFCK